jgi:uncharacterized membrane protein
VNTTHRNAHILFTILSVTGMVLVLVEIGLYLAESSLCTSEGCRIVAEQARFGTISILLLGLALFAALTLLTLVKSTHWRKYCEGAISTILIAACAAEGFLVGYQIFRLHTPCAFCLAVCAIVVTLGIVWMVAGHKEILSGGICFLAIVSLFYLITPLTTASNDWKSLCIADEELILFHDDDCPSCKYIENTCTECNIKVIKVDAQNYLDFLSCLNISRLPVLLVNKDDEKTILVGTTRIEEYLMTILKSEQ